MREPSDTAGDRADAPSAPTVPTELSALSELRADEFVDVAPDGVLVVDGNGHIRFANRRCSELFGALPADLVGRPVEDLVPDDARGRHRAHRLRYGAAPSNRPMGAGLDLEARRADGTTLPVDISLSPFTRNGEQLFIAVVRDVTDRRAVERRAHWVGLMLDESRDGLLVIDDERRIRYASKGAAAQLGYRTEELAAMTLAHFVPGLTSDDHDAFTAALHDAAGGVVQRRTFRRCDGSDFPVELSARWVPGSTAGAPDVEPAIVLVFRDVSERDRAEEALAAAHTEMTMLADRERIARDLHDTVIQRLFSTGLSLQGMAALVPDELSGRLLRAIDDLDETMREIRTTIFTLHSDRGRDHDLSARIDELLREAARNLGFRPSLHVEGDPAGLPAALAADLLAVLREALANVARHAAATDVDVHVRIGERLAVEVSDNGRGLPVEVRVGGHGLANLRDRAHRHRGACELERRNSGGTTLRWWVPLAA